MTASKDIATVVALDNKKVKEMPTGVGEVLGYMVDKTIETTTGKKSTGLFQTIGNFFESAFNLKNVIKQPIVSKNQLENIDKTNNVVQTVDKAVELKEKIEKKVKKKE